MLDWTCRINHCDKLNLNGLGLVWKLQTLVGGGGLGLDSYLLVRVQRLLGVEELGELGFQQGQLRFQQLLRQGQLELLRHYYCCTVLSFRRCSHKLVDDFQLRLQQREDQLVLNILRRWILQLGCCRPLQLWLLSCFYK